MKETKKKKVQNASSLVKEDNSVLEETTQSSPLVKQNPEPMDTDLDKNAKDKNKEKAEENPTGIPAPTSKPKLLLLLFGLLFKIGLFTFGGGYAMIPLLENEFVIKRKWVDSKEFMNILVLSESTPGPIAINFATYIGYKMGKIWGSVMATIGVVLPSFIIIFIITLFFDNLLEYKVVSSAFRGIQIAVIFLILSAGIRMLVKSEKSILNYVIFIITTIAVVLFSIFAVSFSSILYIIIFATVGLLVYLIKNAKSNKKEGKL